MLDDSVLEQIAQSQVGAGVRMWRQAREATSPMNVVLDVVDALMPHSYAIFWVEGGPPETFSLPDLEPAVVLFSTRHLEVMGHLRGIMTTPWLDGQFLEAVGEQVSLRIMAELVLRQGDPALACYLLAESLSSVTVDVPQLDLMVLEREPISERYMSIWFYALLHELGHVAARDRARTNAPDNSGYTSSLIEDTMRSYFGADNVDRLRKRRVGLGRPDALDEAVLVAELDADLFSVQALYEATIRVFQRNGTLDQFSVGSLAKDILLMFGLFHIVNSCALAARIRDRPGAADMFGNVANGVRTNVIIDFMANYLVARGYLKNSGAEVINDVRRQLLSAHASTNERFATFDRGHARALRRCLFPNERRLDAFGQLAQALEKNAAQPRMEIRRLVALGKSLAIQHPDLTLLADLEASPTSASRILAERQRVHLLAWVSGADEVDMPFGLSGRDELVVFVFHDNITVDYFIEESRPILQPGLRLTTTAIISPTDQNVVITVAQSLPAELRRQLRVVFEGTTEFDEYVRQLNDGTFWPDDSTTR